MGRIGFRTAGFREWRVEDALAALGDLGYDGVELCLENADCRPEGLTPVRCRELATVCRHAGLAVASVSYHGDGEESAERWSNIVRSVALTPEFGTDVLITNAGHTRPGETDAQWRQFVQQLGDLMPQAEATGCRVAVEPEPGMFVGSSDDGARLLREVGSPHLAINLDVGHAFLTDPDVPQTIRELGTAIAHTHLEGMPRGEHRHLVPGEGDLDLGAVLAALGDTHYGGYLTVDLFNIADDPVGYARRSLAGLRALLP